MSEFTWFPWRYAHFPSESARASPWLPWRSLHIGPDIRRPGSQKWPDDTEECPTEKRCNQGLNTRLDLHGWHIHRKSEDENDERYVFIPDRTVSVSLLLEARGMFADGGNQKLTDVHLDLQEKHRIQWALHKDDGKRFYRLLIISLPCSQPRINWLSLLW